LSLDLRNCFTNSAIGSFSPQESGESIKMDCRSNFKIL